jgi:molybdenum cofactor cytidylyltransferase
VKFGPIPVADALGAIVAHRVRTHEIVLKKGQTIQSSDIGALTRGGVSEIFAARLEPGDIGEDEAARRLAMRLAGEHIRQDRPFTGRVNLHAARAGLVMIDEAAAAAVNGVDEAITFATLAPFRAVAAGDMVATIKIIPFAVGGEALCRAMDAAGDRLTIAPFRPLRVGVISTTLPGLKAAVIAKTLEALRARLDIAGATIAADLRVPHEPGALSEALTKLAARCDLLIVFGASAITDRRDVIPAAIEAAGGRVDHFGMPVDPGNLLLLGELAGKPVIGAPGCARSPKENGFDWVLQRILADIPPTRADIQRMGVGGLLMEIVSRPQPRVIGTPAAAPGFPDDEPSPPRAPFAKHAIPADHG